MSHRHLLSILALVLLVGCGGDGETETTTSTTSGASTPSATASLTFNAVEAPSIEYLEGEPAVTKECDDLGWVEDETEKKELAPFTGTTTVEVLACDGVPYVAYLEYEDAGAVDDGLAGALLPYLQEDTTVLMPLIGLDEKIATNYLQTLEEDCGCGELVEP